MNEAVQTAEVRTLRTDKVVAEDYRARLEPMLADLCRIFDEARKEGVVPSFQIQQDAFGRSQFNLTLVKPL